MGGGQWSFRRGCEAGSQREVDQWLECGSMAPTDCFTLPMGLAARVLGCWSKFMRLN